ncbi:MAG: hypothetical protein ACREEY_03345 [Brevundimonas sp.]
MSPPDLQQPVLLSLLGGGFVAAFLHAALPTHWLPFVLVGRAQRWSLMRVITVAVTAGLAHIASTAIVGSLIVAAGLALNAWIGGLLPHLSAALLFIFGAFYLARASLQKPITATGPEAEVPEPAVSNRAAFWGLVLMMAVTPGEVLLPIYLSSATEGVGALALLTLAFAAGTVLGMTLLAALASAGYSILRLERWARYEGAILGVALILIGFLVMTHQH